MRTEQLSHVTSDGWNAVRRHGVRTVIDLRRPRERTDDVPRDLTRIDVDLDGDEPEFWAPYEADGRWGTPLYGLKTPPRRVAEAMTAFAEGVDVSAAHRIGLGPRWNGQVGSTGCIWDSQ